MCPPLPEVTPTMSAHPPKRTLSRSAFGKHGPGLAPEFWAAVLSSPDCFSALSYMCTDGPIRPPIPPLG